MSLRLLVGFLVVYVKWIAAVIAAYLAYRWWRVAWVRRCAVVDAWEREQKAIAARADQQHGWVLTGDPRGTYGEGAADDGRDRARSAGGWASFSVCTPDEWANRWS